MNKKFDFSEIDGALPTAEKMQEQDRIIDALKNNYVHSYGQNELQFVLYGHHAVQGND